MKIFRSNYLYLCIGVVCVVMLLLIIIVAGVCFQRKSSSPRTANGLSKKRYRMDEEYCNKNGKKILSTMSAPLNSDQGDLWIHQNGTARFGATLNNCGVDVVAAEYAAAAQHAMINDMQRFGRIDSLLFLKRNALSFIQFSISLQRFYLSLFIILIHFISLCFFLYILKFSFA